MKVKLLGQPIIASNTYSSNAYFWVKLCLPHSNPSAELLEKVEATKKRLEIIDQTANYLKTLGADEIEPAINMMVGRAFPKYSQKTLDVSWSTLHPHS